MKLGSLFRISILTVIIFINSYGIKAQSVSLTNSHSASVLANHLIGPGVTISNPSLTCNSLANGIFVNVNPTPALSLAIDSGIILCTGRALTLGTSYGMNADRFLDANTSWGITTVDPQITSIAGPTAVQRDLCFLQFEFIPSGDTTYLDYTFASEEYPDFNCTAFNDAFGIFVSPPSSTVFTNYARIPGTTINVGINSINNGTPAGSGSISICNNLGAGSPFTSLYTDNQISNHIIYDGMTKTLKARIPTLPNQTHNLKIAIADIKDALFDSGILLKKSSFTSPPLLQITNKTSSSGVTTNPLYLIEGCNPGVVSFARSTTSSPLTVNVAFSGTTPVGNFSGASSFIINAGSNNFSYNIAALQNGLAQGVRTLRLVFNAPSISFNDTIDYIVKDFANGITVFNNSNDTTICNNTTVSIYSTRTDTVFSRVWTPGTGLSCTNCDNPILSVNNGNIFSTQSISYRITAIGCPTIDSNVNINIQPKPAISLTPTFNICRNDSAILNPIIIPIVGTYSFVWTPAINLSSTNTQNTIAKPINNQQYKLVVSTPIGCKDSFTTNVNVSNIRAEIDSMVFRNASCGLGNGSIRLYTRTTPPSFPTYQYSINGGASFSSTGIFNNIPAGTYAVAIRNGVNCRWDTTITLSSGTSAPAATLITTNTTCGLSNGASRLNTKTGNGPFTYQWRQGATTISTDTFISNRAAGTFTFIITDNLGCFAQYNVVLNSSNPLGINFTKVDQSCNLFNGSILSTPINGTPTYTYNWSNGANTGSISGLAAGTYKLTLTDGNNCVKTDSIVLTNFPPPNYTKSSNNAICGNNAGNAAVAISTPAGTPPYTYSWSNGVVTSPTTATTHGVGGLAPGKYFVTVTDSRGCQKVDSVIIGGSPAVTISLSKVNATCGNPNGSISTTVSTGTSPYSYAWNDGFNTPNRVGLFAGIYSVTVTDNLNCTAVASTTILVNSNPALTLNKVDATCGNNNGIITSSVLNGKPPITYVWSNGATSNFISNLAPNTYSLTITDSFGCQKTQSITIVGVPGANFDDTTIQLTCSSSTGQIVLSNIIGKSPLTLTWSDGGTGTTRSNLAPGTYSVFLIDSNGCSKTKSFTIIPYTKPNLTDSIVNANCNATLGGIYTKVFGGIPGYTYAWNSGETSSSIINKPPGTYTLIVTDLKGCKDTLVSSIVRNNNPTFTDSIVHPKCGFPNGQVILKNVVGTGTLTYAWSPANSLDLPFRRDLDTGRLYVTVTDALGCFKIDTFDLTSKGAIVLDSFTIVRPNCADSNGTMTVHLSGGNKPYQYNWSNGDKTKTADSLKHGYYNVTITDSLGCTIGHGANVKNQTNMQASIDIKKTRCDSVNGRLTATGVNGTPPYIYIWRSKDTVQTIDSLNIGAYVLRIIDSNKCILDTVELIKYTHYPILRLDSLKEERCDSANGKAYISIDSVIAPIKIRWNGTIDSVYQKITLTGPQMMTVSVTDSQKCVATISFEVPEKPVISRFLTTSLPGCGNNNGFVTANTNPLHKSLIWSTGSTNPTISNLSPGRYTVTITDSANCVYVLSDTLYYSTPPTRSFSIIRPNCGRSDGSILANVSTLYSIASTTWVKKGVPSLLSDSLRVINRPEDTFVFTVSDQYGCVRRDTIPLKDSAAPTATATIKNAFCNDGTGKIKLTPSTGSPPYTYFWNNFTTNDSIVNVFAGSHSVTITDLRNCSRAYTYNLLFKPTPIISLQPTDSKCGPDKGSISSSIALGTSPFLYTWSNSQTTSSISNLVAGKYKLTVTDSAGCVAVDSVNIVSQPPLSISIVKINANCNLNNGSAITTILSGKPPYVFNWNGSINSLGISALDTGSNIFQIVDSNLCIIRDTIKITRVPIHTVNNTVVNDNCTYKIGQVQTAVVNGQAPFTYLWSNGLGSNKDLIGIGAGNYTLSVSDNLGCLVTKLVTVGDTAGPSLNLVKTDPSCGLLNGTVSAFISSIRTPLSYFWNNVSGGTSISGLNGGKFVFKVIDSRGCIKQDSVVMDTIYPVNMTLGLRNASCNTANGSIKIKPTGGTGIYSYSWGHTVSNTDSLFGMGPGKYYFTVTDSKGCSKSDSATLTQLGLPTITFNNIPSKCRQSNGTINAVVNNAVGTVTYSWSPSSGNVSTITNAAPGAYGLTITDDASCSVLSSTTLISRGVDSIQASVLNPKCDVNNGKINLSLLNSVNPVNYSWSNGGNKDSIVNLYEGSYTVTVTDSICNITKTYSLVNSKKPDIVLTPTRASCGFNNGFILSNINFGTNPITYAWSNGSSSSSISSLDTGKYTLTVTDNVGCMDTAFVQLLRIPTLVATFNQVKSKCGDANGAINTSITGGIPTYSYAWSTGESSANLINKSPGFYTLTLSDNGNCTITQTVELQDFKRPIITSTVINSVCGKSNGSITAGVQNGTGTPPFSYQWNTGGTTSSLTNLSNGFYFLTVTDATPCKDSVRITVDRGATPTTEKDSINSTCGKNNGKAWISLPRGVDPIVYQWSNGASTDTIRNLSAGKYYVTLTDARQCEIRDTITILTTTLPIPTLVPSQSFCLKANGTINNTITNGTPQYTYLWSNGTSQLNASSLFPGSYSVTVTDQLGCTGSASAVITERPNNLRATYTKLDLKCFQDKSGTITIQASNGATPYLYRTKNTQYISSSTINGLSSGNDSIIVEDNDGCLFRDTFSLQEPPKLGANLISIKDLLCNNEPKGEIESRPFGGTPRYDVLWIPSGQVAFKAINLDSGQHKMIVTDDNKCTDTFIYNLSEPTELVVKPKVTENACFGERNAKINIVASSATPPYNYLWQDGTRKDSLTKLRQGTYGLTITDVNGCVDTFRYSIVDPQRLSVTNVETIDTKCEELNRGEIKVLGFGGSGIYQYSIDTGKTYTINSRFKNLLPGRYQIIIKDANGCQVKADTIIKGPPPFRIQGDPKSQTIDLGKTATIGYKVLQGDPNWINSRMWKGGVGLSCVDCDNPQVSPYEDQKYIIEVQYFDKCTATDTVEVLVNDPKEIYIPSAFSPHSQNDSNKTFKIFGDNILSAKMTIFNRWGESMYFTTEGNRKGWDGYYQGELAPQAVYYYLVEVVYLNQRREIYKGDLTLIR